MGVIGGAGCGAGVVEFASGQTWGNGGGGDGLVAEGLGGDGRQQHAVDATGAGDQHAAAGSNQLHDMCASFRGG